MTSTPQIKKAPREGGARFTSRSRSMAAIFPMMMHTHLMALTMVVVRGCKDGCDGAERDSDNSQGQDNFFHDSSKVMWVEERILTALRITK
jgi:hypothetical protein